MAENDKRQPNNSDELIDIKSLIGDADGGGFSLDDILSEYGVAPIKKPAGAEPAEEPVLAEQETVPGLDEDLPWPEAPRRPVQENKVVAFPGAESFADADGEDEEPVTEQEEQDDVEEDLEEEDDEDKIIEFPEEESAFAALIKDLKDRANDYADQMFEESEQMDQEEIRRLEKLIPGTDQEEEKANVRFVRPPRKEETPPPDVPPQELARQFTKKLKGMRLKIVLLFFLSLLSLTPIMVPLFGIVLPPPMDNYQLQVFFSAGLLAAGMLLSLEILTESVKRMRQGRVGMDTLTCFACVFTLADAVLLGVQQNRQGQLPYCAVALVTLLLLSHGEYHKRCAQRLSCRTAAASAQPYLVTLDEGKWNGKATYSKWSGEPVGFGSQIQMDDGAQRIYKRLCPVLAVACVLLSLLACVAQEKPELILWCLSTTFLAASALGGSMAYGRPYHKIARRLSQSGAALAGWPGMADSRRGDRLLLTDWDLFPPGYVEFNGIKVFGDHSMERVVAYTATLLRDAGSGLEKLFHDQLRMHGGIFRHAERLTCYEGGGLSALIRGNQVLVGSHSFMNLMEVTLPEGLRIKNAVFCAIDGELAGVFVLHYSLPDVVFPSLSCLLGEKVGPVLATRDFNIIPAMLQQRFKLAADRMDFPPVQPRRELSDPNQSHSTTLTAVLCREGLAPFAEAVVGARRLRRSARVGAVVSCVGSVLGVLLCYYLTSVGAFTSLAPLNLLIYLVMWLLPVWFLTDWAPRY